MKFIRWILAIAILSIWAALIGTSLYVAMYEPPVILPEGEAIVVLAGDDGASGGMSAQTEQRVAKAVELFNEGVAPQLVLSGGGVGGTAVAEEMRSAAVAQGVPEDAIVTETESLSTIQNAMFLAEKEELNLAAPVVLVTHRYHLPRANATLRWAGVFAEWRVENPEGWGRLGEWLLRFDADRHYDVEFLWPEPVGPGQLQLKVGSVSRSQDVPSATRRV